MGAWNNWAGTPLAANPVATAWLRRTVDLTAAQAKGAAMLDLGVFDDMDSTFVNGTMVGNAYAPKARAITRCLRACFMPGAMKSWWR
jgi:sialate O-acetylesterase